MGQFTTWITEKDGKVGRVRQVSGNNSPGPNWQQVPNDWRGNPGDDLALFGTDGRRMLDKKLIEKGLLKDNRGLWFHKERIEEKVRVSDLGKPCPGNEYTLEEPLKDEPYQKWDPKKNKFIVDEEKKGKAEKEKCRAEKLNAIQTAEKSILRSLIAKQRGKATKEDEQYFEKIGAEIDTLHRELQEIKE